MSNNGTVPQTVKLPPAALRKLARLHARTEGMQVMAQALSTTIQQAQAALQEALTEACEEEGMRIPRDNQSPVDIDWRTGVVTMGPPEPAQGMGGGLPLPPPPVEAAARDD